MSKCQNDIKVFHPNSKKIAFRVPCLSTDKGAEAVEREIQQPGTADLIKDAFASLKRLGGHNVTLYTGDRRIRVELAKAA